MEKTKREKSNNLSRSSLICADVRADSGNQRVWESQIFAESSKQRIFAGSRRLSGPISHDIAILSLRYPISRDAFSGRLGAPQNGAIPLWPSTGPPSPDSPKLLRKLPGKLGVLGGVLGELLRRLPGRVPLLWLVAQCSATPATVAATPLCSATPLQTQISVRHLPAQGGELRHQYF